jgi:16S rRNA processing protein RimM
LRRGSRPPEPCELSSVRRTSGGLLIRLPGVDDRDGAAALRGAVLCVTRDALAATEPDEYYVCDLAGCTVRVGDQEIGQVVDVATYPTCDALVIRRPDGTELQVPMHEDFVAAVRIADRAVDLRTIEGLE